MYNIHEKAKLVRAKGLRVELPYDTLIFSGRNPETEVTNVRISTRKGFPHEIKRMLNMLSKGFFNALAVGISNEWSGDFRKFLSKNSPPEWVLLGLHDPSNNKFVEFGSNSGSLGISGTQELSEEFLEDLWVVLCSCFQTYATNNPTFFQTCSDFIDSELMRHVEKNSETGNC